MLDRPNPRLSGTRLWLGVNYWSRAGGPLMWRHYEDAVVRAELRALREEGITVVRSFCRWPDFHPAPDTIDRACVANFRAFLAAAEDLDMATIPTFIVGHMSGDNADVPWRDGRSLYTDGFMLGQQAFFIREMVARTGDSPAIAGWLISNEMPLYAGHADRGYVRAWSLICNAAVRAGGSQLPVSLGDGGWTQEITGRDTGFRLRDQRDCVDFYGPHSYPAGPDQARQFAEAAFACELSHLGKPVILEEFGVTSSFCSDDNGAHYYRQVLHQSLLAGASGWIAWNNTDFDLAGQDPYRHHPYELGFGLMRADGSPKPALAEMATFRRILDAVDVSRLHRVPTRSAVLLPAIVDLDLPGVPQADREAAPRACLEAWLAARSTDLSPAVVRESEPLPGADLLLIPSNKALLGPTFASLAERVRGGAHAYLSWTAGLSDTQRGAWWPDIEWLTGARHMLRYGMTPAADEEIQLTVTEPFGDLVVSSTLTFLAAGPAPARSFLPVEPTTATVLAADQRGRPALLRQRHDAGAFYLFTYPIEYFASARTDDGCADDTWRLYQAIATEAGITPPVHVDNPAVCVDQMRHEDGTLYSWLISRHPGTLIVKPVPTDGSRLVDVLDGEDVTDECLLPPYGVRVLRHWPA